MENQLDYSPVLIHLKEADKEYTREYGLTNAADFDAMLEKSVIQYNEKNGTNFDAWEAKHQYLEYTESEPQPFCQ